MSPSPPTGGFPAHRAEPLASRSVHVAAAAPDLNLSAHAIARCAERGVTLAELQVVAARPTFQTPQRDGTFRITGVVIGTHARWFVEAIVWIASASCWFVLTVWRSGLGDRPSRSRKGRKPGRRAS